MVNFQCKIVEIYHYFLNNQERGLMMICHFCTDIFRKNKEQGLPAEESFIYEDNNIYVMPDISPLTVGHFLIISKKHYQGYGNATSETLSSLECFLEYYKHKIGRRNYTVFEHGAIVAYNAGASIDHAHMHIVPFEIDMKRKLESEFGKGISCDLQSLKDFAKRKDSYLFFKTGRDKNGYAYPVGKIESQYLRKLVNQLMQRKTDFNWKKTYEKETAYLGFLKTLAWWKSLGYPVNYKWKKKLILEKYNLIKYKDLIEQTTRFKIGEETILKKMIKKEMIADKKKYCRVVLVPLKHQYKLPNCIIYEQSELEKLESFLKQKEQYVEIWYHTNEKYNIRNKFAGRISFTFTEFDTEEIIEIVTGDNPREIEKYTIEQKKGFYVRFSRKQRILGYQIDSIQINKNKYTDEERIKYFNDIISALDIYNEKIFRFANMINQYGIMSFSLDFTVFNRKITFIDWDTSDDERILKYESI